MTSQEKLTKLMHDFDGIFISKCHARGMTEQETQRALLESLQRKVMLNSIALMLQTATAIPPLILPKESECQVRFGYWTKAELEGKS